MAQATSSAPAIPERFIRQIWKNGHFESGALRTSDGKEVEILSPGVLNSDEGPDFLRARLRIGGVLYRGDVELHSDLEEWHAHTHHLNARYNSVILHVVLYGKGATPATALKTESRRTIPLLVLEPYLNASYHALWQSMILGERAERLSTIRCHPDNTAIDESLLPSWIEKLAVERVELKVRRFEERLKELVEEERHSLKEPLPAYPEYDEIPFGINPEDLPPPVQHYSQRDFARVLYWEQLLYEGMMEALGYSKNQEQFLELARNMQLRMVRDHLLSEKEAENRLVRIEAALFGAAGLLPAGTAMDDAANNAYRRSLHAAWRTVPKWYRKKIHHASEWQFFRLRPENFPTVRLAGAARLVLRLTANELFRNIIQMIKEEGMEAKETFRRIEAMFIVPADGFWTGHYRFDEKGNAPVVKLVGRSRAAEIVLNTVIPLCLLYARIFRDKDVRRGALKLFRSSPPSSENTITRTMSAQLLKDRLALDSAMLQQGTLQLYKLYCIEERCEECAVGKAVFAEK